MTRIIWGFPSCISCAGGSADPIVRRMRFLCTAETNAQRGGGKRLAAIREYSDLGSGFKIAMRDLEIRGAGNLLGAEQSGHMEAVGYDLYCKMLHEAVKEARGEAPAEQFETSVDIRTDAFIPSTYIANESQKLDMYKRIAGIETDEEAEEMLEELIDRLENLRSPCRIC